MYPVQRMGLSDAHNSHKVVPDPTKRAKRGFNGLPRWGRELAESAVRYLCYQADQQHFTPVFFTVTTPSRYQDGTAWTEQDYKHCAANWSELVRQFNQELSRQCKRRGLPDNRFHVTETQDKRWQRDRVLALHLHLIFLNAWDSQKQAVGHRGFGRSGDWVITKEETDAIVQRVFNNIMGKPVDVRSACNVQAINSMKKMAFYTTKMGRVGRYMSKGSQVLEEIQQSEWADFLPSSWYGSDKETRDKIRDSIQVYDIGEGTAGEVVQELQRISDEFASRTGRALLTTPHITTVESGEGLTPVAVTCRVRRFDDVSAALDAISMIDLTVLKRKFDFDRMSVSA